LLYINIIECKRGWNRVVGLSVGRSVGLSVYSVGDCGKTTDEIWMPFRVVSGVGRGMSALNGDGVVEGQGAVLKVNVGHPIVTNGDSVA